MKIPYRNNLPLVDIRIIGKHAENVEAHLDFAASKTIIPSSVADELGLKFVGYEKIATGAGVIIMPEYEAAVEVFNMKHEIFVGCIDLPKETQIRALLGRDILDSYEVCLNGKAREIMVKQ